MSVILITGASRGIGLEFARQFAARGDEVIATCRNPDAATELRQLADAHSNLSVEELDVSSDATIGSLANSIKERGIAIDILVSNAGVLLNEAFENWTRKRFSDTLDANVTGAAMLAQAFVPLMAEGGKLIHISSGLGSLEMAGEGMTDADSYSISKAAMNMLTVRLCWILRSASKTVVSMSPGWVATDMGGPGASLQVDESVSKMIRTIAALTLSDSGRFIDNEGNSLPW